VIRPLILQSVSDLFSVPNDLCIGKSAYTSSGKGRDLEKLWLDFFFVLFIVGFEDCIQAIQYN